MPSERYKHHRFPSEIIGHGVWHYFGFCLSDRDVEEEAFERAQRFLPRRHRLSALAYRQEMRHRFDIGQDLTNLPTAA